MLPDKKRVITNFKKENYFSMLRKARERLGLSRQQLGDRLGKSGQQITRYEGEGGEKPQYPPIPVLIMLCEILQISPNNLLQFEEVDIENSPEQSVIYDWKLKKDRIYWDCPICLEKNISYGDFSTKKSRRHFLKDFSALCEYCDSYFDKLEGLEI